LSEYQEKFMKKLLFALALLLGLAWAPQTVLAGDVSGVIVTTNGNQATNLCHTSTPANLPPQSVNTVDLMACFINPTEISIAQGATAVWTNQDAVVHNVRGATFESGPIGSHMQYTHTFPLAGRFSYVDDRSGASGLVIVSPAQNQAAADPRSTVVTPSAVATTSVPSTPDVVATPQAQATVVPDVKGSLPVTGPSALSTVGWIFLASGILGGVGYQLYQRRKYA
jgi:plastocyanin